MNEMSTPARSLLMASATLMIGFSSLGTCRDNAPKANSRLVARGDISLAFSALAYITWPKESFVAVDAPFVIGILGKPSADHEKLLAPYAAGKQRIQGRTVQVRNFETIADIGESHVLFVTQACSREAVRDALKSVAGKPVLTIGDSDGFARSGGVLNVVKSGDAVILELNQRAATRQHLKIDVRLANVSVLTADDPAR